MAEPPELPDVDRDGALRELAEPSGGDSRSVFVRKAALAAAGALAALAGLGAHARRAGATTTNDVAILNFALTLEYLEADFYADAIAKGGLRRPRVAALAATIQRQESAHVNFLLKALGTAAVPKPAFDFKQTTANDALFLATATFLEETGVRGYLGQAPLIDDPAVLKAVLALQTVEARHAAWVRTLRDVGPSPDAFAPALTMKQTLAALRRRGLLP